MIVNRDIQQLLADSAELPSNALLERAGLCLECRQRDYAEALYTFIKEREPENSRARIGLALLLDTRGRTQEALLELVEVRRSVASRLSFEDEDIDAYLEAYTRYTEIEHKRGRTLTSFQSIVLDGLKLRIDGKHNEAYRVFKQAVVNTTDEDEKFEALFYITTLYKLPTTIIEQTLRKFKRIPRFIFRFQSTEKKYLRKMHEYISDKYRPCDSPEDLERYFIRPKKAITQKEQEAIKNINSVEDLGI
ncbi:hypothetical protein KY335_04350 [Candidatus Woesearchaeota archaeon]|nr:hypothetical protein [Candidatus Woesearchaeota archaeon]MBW3014439.1 hypothetical protein [Candidatus Woesearchaeota archaeon]